VHQRRFGSHTELPSHHWASTKELWLLLDKNGKTMQNFQIVEMNHTAVAGGLVRDTRCLNDKASQCMWRSRCNPNGQRPPKNRRRTARPRCGTRDACREVEIPTVGVSYRVGIARIDYAEEQGITLRAPEAVVQKLEEMRRHLARHGESSQLLRELHLGHEANRGASL
jgi:hypothetical protein